ncbi:MAG: hypothetical protein E6H74_01320 [Betaproteobacteria bacterium]|nr:MAG: hypothetical protein E6H74_01320 [Betaproteobacteria bacterium]
MRNLLVCLAAASMLLVLPASAQHSANTATDFYLGYRAAWSGASTMDPLLTYIAKDSRRDFEKMPPEQRKAVFDVMKQMGTIRNLKVVKETKTADGFVLDVTGIGPDDKPATGTVDIVWEGPVMKLKKEAWRS